MGSAAFWGALASLPLLLGGAIAYTVGVSERLNAVIMALGCGLLFGSVAFELVEDSLDRSSPWVIGASMLVGAAAFVTGNWLIARSGGKDRKDFAGHQADGNSKAIVMGSVLDGIPESFVLGLTVLQGQVSVGLLIGVAASNLPEGLSSSAGLRRSGTSGASVMVMWTLITAVAGISAAAGYVLLDTSSDASIAVVQSFAAGALLTMLSDTMLPESYGVEGVATGVLVVLGFSISVMLGLL